MPSVKSADVFIERSLNLIQINPTTTRVSITYGSESKKNSKSKDKVSKPSTTTSSDENKSFVSFKTYDPVSGQLHKIKTNKVKELSKLLNALGPHGVSVPKISKSSSTSSSSSTTEEPSKKKQKIVEQVSLRGFSSVWANAEVKEDESVPEQPKQTDASNNGQQSGGSKKNKKKKGKK